MASTRREGNGIKSPSTCCVCFPSTSTPRNSIQLSEVYCPSCSDVADSPACLTTITKHKPPEQVRTLLNVESEIEYSKNFNKKLVPKKLTPKNKRKGKENKEREKKEKANQDEYEIACEAADDTEDESGVDDGPIKIGIMTETDKKLMIRVNGREERPSPCVPTSRVHSKATMKSPKKKSLGLFLIRQHAPNALDGQSEILELNNSINNNTLISDVANKDINEESDGNNNNDDDKVYKDVKYSTLPMVNKHKHKKTIAIPQRVTPDGTKIFYLCDLPKKLKRGSILLLI